MKKSLLGRVSDLTVTRLVDFGAYLDGGEEFGDILLPARYIGAPLSKGDTVKVFVYRDSEDRPIATTQLPRASVGEFAMLRVVDVNRAGAFLDWGLPKDLLVPYREQLTTMHPGEEHIIYIYMSTITRGELSPHHVSASFSTTSFPVTATATGSAPLSIGRRPSAGKLLSTICTPE